MEERKEKKVCCIFNTPAHYCKSIYSLMDKTFNCSFVFGDDAPTVKRFDTTHLKDCSFNHYKYLGKVLFVPGMIKYAFKNYNYYIINPATNSFSMWLFLITLKLFPSKKVYTWTHGMYGYENKRQLFFKKLQYQLCDGEFVYGDYAIELMKKRGYDGRRLYPIHNSLDYESQLALRNTQLESDVYTNHFGNNKPVVVMIGRLNKRKKLPMLLEAAEKLKKQGLIINVVFIGDGEEKENLVQLARKMSLEPQVWMYGACYDEKENAELLYNADLCVMPGDIGLTAIHSMMFGLPVITHDSFPNHGPEFEVIKPNVTGTFFKNDDVDSLATNIKGWLNKDSNRDEIRQSCYNIIDTEWNPDYQIRILKTVLI